MGTGFVIGCFVFLEIGILFWVIHNVDRLKRRQHASTTPD
jgi:hypothetical protein